ncbi:MAG: cell division protein FtsZ [Celeribacter sp.]|jgi:cell division protein FtsZ
MTLNLTMPEQDDLKPRITVFGVGGAGGNAVNNMIEQALEGVEFVVANTDAQALQQNRSVAKIQMGVKVTEGLGAGARPSVGAAAAEETIEEIVDHLAGAHMCFITAGMGGGTGTGAAPIIAQAARELGVLTVGVVTKPFQFEGSKRMRLAEEGIDSLQKVVDTLIIIPNQNLFRLANDQTTFTEAFAMADDVLYQGVKGVTDLMVRPGLINLDFADVRSVMDEMGKAMMGTGEAEGEERAKQAAEKAIANPLLDEISLKGAKGVLINITGGYDLTLFELDEAANIIREQVDDDANIIVGSTLDTEMGGKMRVSVVATGIDAVEASAEMPVPRRSLAKPLENARIETPTAEPASQQRAEPVTARAAAPAPQARAEEEPSLFGGYVPRQPETHAEDESDELPPPAYQPAQQPEHLEAEEEPADSFVAPQRSAAAGTPSAEALARLHAAVSRVPGQPAGAPAPSGAASQGQPQQPAARPGSSSAAAAAAGDKARFGIGSLINRMSGHAEGEARQQPAAPRQQPPLQQRSSGGQQPAQQPVQHFEEEADLDPEQERIEIPAFLRRQAN